MSADAIDVLSRPMYGASWWKVLSVAVVDFADQVNLSLSLRRNRFCDAPLAGPALVRFARAELVMLDGIRQTVMQAQHYTLRDDNRIGASSGIPRERVGKLGE